MGSLFSRLGLHSIAITSVGLLLLNLSVQSPVIAFIALIGITSSTSHYLGSLFFKSEPWLLRLFGGLTAGVAILSILGAILYYLIPLNTLILTSLLSTFTLGCAVYARKIESPKKPERKKKIGALLVLQIVFLLPWWSTLATADITEALRSPWDVISPTLLISLFFAALCTGALLRYGNRSISLATSILLFLSGFSLFALAYPIGFGFDPFIHQATVAHILEFGTITPKPLYYIGQYALELILSGVFLLPLELVDHWLVPVLAAIILPTSLLIGAARSFAMKGNGFLFALFLLPLSAFVLTTPQSLAYLFTAASLFLLLPVLANEKDRLVLPGILAIAAMITHPLAGIPAVLFFFLALFSRITHHGIRTAFVSIGLTLSSIALPSVFFIQSKISALSFEWDMNAFLDIALPSMQFGFNPWLNFAQSFLYLIPFLLFILALAGTYIAHRLQSPRSWHLPFLAAISWLVNFLILRGMKFDFLIEYEQENYAQRLLVLAVIFFIPAAATALAYLSSSLKNKPKLIYTTLFFFALLFIGSLYVSYPRNDGTVRSSGFNVSQYDIDAAYAIAAHAGDVNYLVLANQTVSSAALREFGFIRYYENDLFYYPIPTSSPLYSDFLVMADENPSHETANEVMKKTGADRMYFVLNDYWWNAEATAEAAKKEADDWFAIGPGSILIFVYESPYSVE
jgi:hypothetical protein